MPMLELLTMLHRPMAIDKAHVDKQHADEQFFGRQVEGGHTYST